MVMKVMMMVKKGCAAQSYIAQPKRPRAPACICCPSRDDAAHSPTSGRQTTAVPLGKESPAWSSGSGAPFLLATPGGAPDSFPAGLGPA